MKTFTLLSDLGIDANCEDKNEDEEDYKRDDFKYNKKNKYTMNHNYIIILEILFAILLIMGILNYNFNIGSKLNETFLKSVLIFVIARFVKFV
jgi:uncharacterized ion transporter superfamily protein YfcC